MKTKRIGPILAMLATLSLFAPPALPWGSATHAYINAKLSEELGDRGILRKNVIYGGMAGDVFNFMFDVPLVQMQYLYAASHGLLLPSPSGLNTVLPILDAASTRRETAAAFGFLTHNNVNGADKIAHGYPYNSADGYIIAKAIELRAFLAPLVIQAGYSIPDPVLLEISHTFVEYAADLLIRREDRAIGARIITAALTRDRGFPGLLVESYAPGFAAAFSLLEQDAATLIRREERKFRRLMISYGQVLQHGDRRAQKEMAKFLADIAPGFLAPFGIDIPRQVLLPLIQAAIGRALELCKDDLMPAVEDTIVFVRDNLANCRDGDCGSP